MILFQFKTNVTLFYGYVVAENVAIAQSKITVKAIPLLRKAGVIDDEQIENFRITSLTEVAYGEGDYLTDKLIV